MWEMFRVPKVYLAGSYTRKEEIRAYAEELQRMGVEVTARWFREPHAANVTLPEVPLDKSVQYAQNDIDDINACDTIISFTEDPVTGTPRGGRHVEFGYALAKGKQLICVGPWENIFHYLPQVTHFESWDHLMIEAYKEYEKPRMIINGEAFE